MSPFVKAALLTDLIAMWLEKVFPTAANLPITGDHFGQLAVLVVLGVIFEELNSWK